MASLNRIELIGNLTHDPEIKATPAGRPVGRLRLAVNKRVSDGAGGFTDKATFLDIEVWDKQAEFAREYLKKGRQVFIDGHVDMDHWDDKQTGQKRSKLKIIANNVQSLGARPPGDGAAQPPRGQAPAIAGGNGAADQDGGGNGEQDY